MRINFNTVGYHLSKIIGLLGLSMIIPLCLSYVYQENTHQYFILPIIICLLIGIPSLGKSTEYESITFRDSIFLVFMTWISAGILGGLPFYISHYFPSFIDSFFESVSGFTATGSTILSDIESLPKSLLFWRSETHWLGGMGIIVLVLAIFPTMKGKKFLFESEAPISPDEQRLFPRISEVAKIYWKIYLGLTILQILLLLPAMDLYDSITHSFASIAGGGFSTKNNSIAFFDSFYVELILEIFMIAGATSFILHYYALKGKLYRYWRNTAFKAFIAVIFSVTLLIALNLYLLNDAGISFFTYLRQAFFQVVSIITTTGFATEDFKFWPVLAQMLILLLMFIGGMSASTSGSIKISRLEVLFRDLKNKIIKLIHPNAVTVLQIRGQTLKSEVTSKVQLFTFLYIVIFVLAGLLITLIENSPETSFSAVAATLGNVGPGIGKVGPFDNFVHFSSVSKLILSGCMLIGRLEIWTVILIFSQDFWML